MRETKFRAWDKEQKIWLDRNRVRIEGDGVIYRYYVVNGWLLAMNKEGDWTVEIVLYTGLKDKDDKEIWEGDILEDHYWNSLWFTKNIEVKIPDVYMWLNGHRNTKGSYYKIIGNIYENPELLKED